MTTRRQEQGFTLLEVLLAALIGAFVLLVALVSFRTVTVARDEVHVYSRLLAECDFVYRQVRGDLASFYRSARPDQMKLVCTSVPAGDLSADRLRFYRVDTPEVGADRTIGGDLYEVEYGLVRDGENRFFLGRRYGPVRTADQGNRQGLLTRLAGPVTGLAFEFYDGVRWQSGWNRPGSVPTMVRLTLTLTDETGRLELPFSQAFSLEPIPQVEAPEDSEETP